MDNERNHTISLNQKTHSKAIIRLDKTMNKGLFDFVHSKENEFKFNTKSIINYFQDLKVHQTSF